ncbi:MAG: hypothetical protein ACK40M_10435 [Flavobacteriales bacterium]
MPRKAEFFVPTEVAGEFAQELVQKNLSNTITGTTEDDELVIEVEYERDGTKEVDELENILEKLIEQIEEEEEDEDKK